MTTSFTITRCTIICLQFYYRDSSMSQEVSHTSFSTVQRDSALMLLTSWPPENPKKIVKSIWNYNTSCSVVTNWFQKLPEVKMGHLKKKSLFPWDQLGKALITLGEQMVNETTEGCHTTKDKNEYFWLLFKCHPYCSHSAVRSCH